MIAAVDARLATEQKGIGEMSVGADLNGVPEGSYPLGATLIVEGRAAA